MDNQQEEQSDITETAVAPNSVTASDGDKSVWDYFILCITEKYFCFKGRARRKEYWSFVLFQVLATMLLQNIVVYLKSNGGNPTGVEILSVLLSIAFFIPSFAVLCRRLHDVNFSGWWIGLPILGSFTMGMTSGYLKAMGKYSEMFGSNGITDIVFLGISLVVIVAWLVIFVVIFFKSDMKENKYGPVPEGVK